MKSGKPIDSTQVATVKQQELEEDETCCVCYEVMNNEENLTFCKVGCGKNIHTECMERWVRHKVSSHT